jgi:hypothetical protein
MKSRVRERTIAALDLLLLLGATIFFYPRVGLPGWISPGGDMVGLMLPAREWASRWLGRGIIPLWNPLTFGGVPFVGAMQAGVFYPPNLLLGAFLSPLTAINVLRLAHIYLFGALTWFFLRVERGLARPAALLGAIAVAGSSYIASHTDHVNQLAAIAWLPALVACQWRWQRTGSRGALLAFAAVLAVQILAGHPQAVFYSLLLCGAIALFWILDFRFWISEFDESHRRSLKTGDSNASGIESRGDRQSKIQNLKSKIVFLFVAIFGGFLLVSIQVLPTAETARMSRRSADDLDYALFGSMPRRAVWTLVAPRAFGDPLNGYSDPACGGESGSFIGRTTLLLALIAAGAGIARRRPYAIFWASAVLAAYVLALGGYGPFGGPGHPSPIYRAYLWLLSPARHLRVPPRILLLATFGMAVLAAEGLNGLLGLRFFAAGSERRRIAHLVAWGAVAVLTVELWAFQSREFHNQVVRCYPPEIMLSGEAREALAPLLRPDSPPPSLADFRLFRLIGVNDPDYLMDVRPDAVRNRYVRLQPDLGMMVGVAEIEGYEEGLLPPIRYFDFLNCFNRNLRSSDPDAVLLALMNVRYLYADYNQPIQSPTWRLVGRVTEPSTGRLYRLYQNPLWLPVCVWADWLSAEIHLGELRGMLSRTGRLSDRMTERQTYGQSPGGIGAGGYLVEPARVAALRAIFLQPNRIAVQNTTRRGGKLLVAQNPYPGWIARMAGRTAIMEAATDFSGAVDVPPGSEAFELCYWPFSFRIGAYGSGVAFGVWIALLVVLVPPPKAKGLET